MTGPDKDAAAGGGHLRAAHADREHTVEVLKTAFVQGRLDQDELDFRVGQAYASRTYAELAALTADIPARPTDAGPAGIPAGQADAGPADIPAGQTDAGLANPKPLSTPARTLAKAACRAGICILAALALVGVMTLTHMAFFALLAYYGGVGGMIAASGFLGYGVLDAWHERQARGPLPPRPSQGIRRLESRPPPGTGPDQAPPDARPDQTRADLRTHRPRPRPRRTQPAPPRTQLAKPGLGWAAGA